MASVEGLPIPGFKKEGDEVEVHLGLEQTFEYPGKRAVRCKIGSRGEEMAEAELERVRLLLAARVKRAYWAAVFAGSAVEALERSSARLDALSEDLQAKYRTGAAAYADVLRARAEKARLRNQILEQAREKRAAELALAELLGRPAGEPFVLATPLPFTPLQADPSALVEVPVRPAVLSARGAPDRPGRLRCRVGGARPPARFPGRLPPVERHPGPWQGRGFRGSVL